MYKVVTERPRYHFSPGSKGRRANLQPDLLPKFEGMKRLRGGHKWQRHLYGPLRRWLQGRVGRPWNDIYSEACTVIKKSGFSRINIKTLLFEMVERHTFVHRGQICMVEIFHHRGVIPITESRGRHLRFFVHPETGLLEVIPKISKRARKAMKPKPPATEHWLSERVAIKQIRGLWFECYYKEVHSALWFDPYDHALERIATRGDVSRDELLYKTCFRKRQLSKRELRRLGLCNAPVHASTGAQSSIGFSRCRLNTVLQMRLFALQ